MRQLEKQLRLWVPRRPSPRVERRLFGPLHSSSGSHFIVPAMAVLLLFCTLATQRQGPMLAVSQESREMAAMVLSNGSASAYLPGSFQREHNLLAGDSFEWTNAGGSSSSMRSSTSSGGQFRQ
jgi:hypothetical protein